MTPAEIEARLNLLERSTDALFNRLRTDLPVFLRMQARAAALTDLVRELCAQIDPAVLPEFEAILAAKVEFHYQRLLLELPDSDLAAAADEILPAVPDIEENPRLFPD